MELIKKYFPNLKADQYEKLEALKGLYEEWNAKINVISRKDMDQFFERHVLHSLAIAKVANFEFGSKILDVGTGGGFPGIPLAIVFPHCKFTLVDSIGKKILVVKEVSQALGLTNVTAIHGRAENVKGPFDHIVSRAVTQMPAFIDWVKKKLKMPSKDVQLQPAIWYLKGGDLTEELKTVRRTKIYELPDFFEEEFFETKKIVRVSSPL